MESFDFNQYKLERNLDIKNTTFLYKNVTDSKSIVLKKYSNGDIEDAKEMMDINHPSISKILSVLPSKDNHSFELTTYYYPNGSLETLINRIENKDTPSWYDPTIISKIILGTIVGLEELHSQGFTHGNLKPSNILIDSNYNPQLTDISFNSITANSQYCAPEIFSKTNNYDKSIDVYSFGMILCFIYVQESPFDESLPLNDLGDFVIDGERPVLPDTIPKNIQDIIEKCWSTSQKDRPTIKYLANIFTTDEYLYPGTKKNLFNFYKDNILHFNPKDFVIEEKKTKEIQEDDKYNEVEPYEIYEEIDKILENNKGMKKLSGLYDDIFSLSSNSIDDSIDELTKIYDENNSHLFDVLICRLLFFSYISQKNDADTVIEFLQKISEHYPKVIELFIQYMNNVLEYTQESRFLLLKMVEHGLIKFEYVAHANESFYFLHYLNESISRSLYYSTKNFEISYEDLRKNNWELHKKFISERINQDQLPKILRNDNIEEFQQISSSPYFDFNQIIHASPYEQHTYINCDVNLLGYCAFFGSLNCFKFLLLNNTYKQSVDLYAVAGGNIEIIYLCEKNDIYFSQKL